LAAAGALTLFPLGEAFVDPALGKPLGDPLASFLPFLPLGFLMVSDENKKRKRKTVKI
jgi:hypothetical protein